MLLLEPPYTGIPRPSGAEISKKSQEGLPGPPGLSAKKVSKSEKDTKKSQKGAKISGFGALLDTFLTLRAGRPGRSFETETPVKGDRNRNFNNALAGVRGCKRIIIQFCWGVGRSMP